MKKVFIALGIVVFCLIALTGVGAYWLDRSLNAPKEHDKAETYIVIEKGSTPSQIITKLTTEGILESSTPTLVYLKTFGNPEGLKAGDYKFPSPISPIQALGILAKGQERVMRIVIPEGFTRFDIAKRLAEWNVNRPEANSMPPVDVEQKRILGLMDDTSLIKDIAPEAKNLEGYMYPSTYDLDPSSTPEKIIATMVVQFRKVWKPEWTAKAKTMNRTPHEIVTIASLIETETGVPTERPIVAGVIYNRLSKGIPLGIDQTAVYIAKMENRWDGTINRSDLDSTSPYNTRKYAGIPPGPISSVSESSIEAALNPATSDYVYYVRNVQLNDGSHWFYSSAAEFERGKAEYQRWLEKEREEKRANDAISNSNQ
ncbi:MAG: endolytic transglycosylase MltG [Acidobacteria bacterium]|nr:MAG: endolytic transglycosylase MltG [Acidobacteriota bacterium]